MTQQELFARQEEAKRRVMEMQSRSRFAAEQMRRDLGAPEPEAPLPPHAEKENGADLEELERLFILSLCLLLSHEAADSSVILGLLYLLT